MASREERKESRTAGIKTGQHQGKHFTNEQMFVNMNANEGRHCIATGNQ